MASHQPSTAQPWVTWGKAIASQIIVWHHLLIYGPLAPSMKARWPDLTALLQQHGRLAVQVFLVCGGYLAARSLWPAPDAPRITGRDWAARVLGRYLRLIPMLLLALVAAIAAAALARLWMWDYDTPAAPTLPQLLAHLLLLQDIVGQPALSAGVWYIAIDLQLFALLGGLAALVHALARPAAPHALRLALGALVLIGGVVASLGWFNLHSDGELWAPYFFGAYGLGVLAAWGQRSPQRAGTTALLLALTGLALLVGWRERVALSGLVALLLLWQPGAQVLARSRLNPLMQWLAKISYAVFLLHYAMSLAVSASVMNWTAATPDMRVAGLVATWLLSLGAGWLAWRWLEAQPARAPRVGGAVLAQG